jgi:tetrahydromethanopterin S-methyltransferase subunit C
MTASLFMAIVGALFGVSFGYFTGDRSLTWAVIGLIVGTALGNFFGKAIDRSVARRK